MQVKTRKLPFDLRRLMSERICDILARMKLTGPAASLTSLSRPIENLYEELHEAGIEYLRPDIYLGDEWFSPAGIPAIAIPFYLAHPALRTIEAIMVGQVEGGSTSAMKKLLRHEAGHCFDHGYKIPRDARWRRTFGTTPPIYRPEVYAPDHRSHNFVKNLPNHYAQSHPDEDFAETFAIAITPESRWLEKYSCRPIALKKLEFVSHLIRHHGRRRPREREILRTYDARRMRMTLARYYQIRLMREAQLRKISSKN